MNANKPKPALDVQIAEGGFVNTLDQVEAARRAAVDANLAAHKRATVVDHVVVGLVILACAAFVLGMVAGAALLVAGLVS